MRPPESIVRASPDDSYLHRSPAPSAAPSESAPSRFAAVALVLFGLALLLAKVRAAWCYRVDSDEPQHLHVVWGWSHSAPTQYRDLFDNHAPLFQLLCAPLFRALGERALISSIPCGWR